MPPDGVSNPREENMALPCDMFQGLPFLGSHKDSECHSGESDLLTLSRFILPNINIFLYALSLYSTATRNQSRWGFMLGTAPDARDSHF